MLFKEKLSNNWGRNVNSNLKIIQPQNIFELKNLIKKKSYIIIGNQRSFGDVGINKNLLISMKNFNKIKNVDEKKGLIEVESGVLLKNILPIIIRKGWFFSVTPGTKYVSIGGMIANNVHGKNTSKNQTRYYVKSIKLLTLGKKIIDCSKNKNKKIFDLTLGGFGLTGIILSAKIKLKKINSPYMEQNILEYENFAGFFTIAKNIKNYEYSVSWVDSFSDKKISGLWFLANHSKKRANSNFKFFKERKLGLLSYLVLRIITTNRFFCKLSNFFYRKYKKHFHKKNIIFDACFYPQDHFMDWNKAYGKNGLFQFQFLVSENKFKNILKILFIFFKEKKLFSSFIIIKKMKEKGKYLNFAGNGYSVSFDFQINDKFPLLKKFLNETAKKHKLKVNFAKDFITNELNAYNYPEFKDFKKKLSSLNPKQKLNTILSKRLKI